MMKLKANLNYDNSNTLKNQLPHMFVYFASSDLEKKGSFKDLH